MNRSTSLTLALALSFALVGIARADLAPLEKAKVPAAVQKAAHGYGMKLEIKSFEEETDDKGKVTGYRAFLSGRLNMGKEESVELEISDAGKIVSENEVIETKDVPANVSATLAASYLAKGKVTRATKRAAKVGEKTTGWELEVELEGKVTLVRFDATGALTTRQIRKRPS